MMYGCIEMCTLWCCSQGCSMLLLLQIGRIGWWRLLWKPFNTLVLGLNWMNKHGPNATGVHSNNAGWLGDGDAWCVCLSLLKVLHREGVVLSQFPRGDDLSSDWPVFGSDGVKHVFPFNLSKLLIYDGLDGSVIVIGIGKWLWKLFVQKIGWS